MANQDEGPRHAKPPLNNDVYDFLKNVALRYLPALGTLYFALAQIWGFPFAEEVIGSIVALELFLGVVLGLSSRAYNRLPTEYDGQLVVESTLDKDVYRFEVGTDLENLRNKQELTIKVKKPA